MKKKERSITQMLFKFSPVNWMLRFCMISIMGQLSTITFAQEQKINLNFKEVSIEEILKEIKLQTGYDYLFNEEAISMAPKVSVQVKDASLEKALKACFKGTGLSYKIMDHVIVVTPSPEISGQTPAQIESFKQTVKGVIIDIDSKTPLPGANIVLLNTDPVFGCISNSNGEFRLENVPIGRHSLKVTFVGYEELIVPEIVVSSGKETALNIKLTEAMEQLDAVYVTTAKGKPRNSMATVSARSFSLEETQRYAASLNDPGRMALVFPGVSTDEDISNQIVIRGNSPNGLLWRMEGIEIPGPNHFSQDGGSSGYISILSSSTLSNSDFYTGAFPAEYGNAMSGVFDISLRTGNNDKREYSFQVGALGVEAAAEGPIAKTRGSYLVNYRYSTLGLLDKIGLNPGDAPLDYQDLTYKVVLPTKKIGEFTLWGFGGRSKNDYSAKADSTQWEEFADRTSEYGEMNTVAFGLNHRLFIDSRSYLKTQFSFAGRYVKEQEYLMDNDYNSLLQEDSKYNSTAMRASLMYNRKVNSKLAMRGGAVIHFFDYDYYYAAARRHFDPVELWGDVAGQAELFQGYFQLKYKMFSGLTLNTGLHYMFFSLGDDHSVEPRFGMEWNPTPKQTIGLGFGVHSKHEPMSIYFITKEYEDGTVYRPNENFGLSKAVHYVASYSYKFNNDMYIKSEVYYQDLSKVPVYYDPEIQLTHTPLDNEFTNDMVIKSQGRNYGVELTMEKFFTSDYYFLVTASLFNSKFKAADKRWYNTKYNKGYITNYVAGKEFRVGKTKKNIVGLNSKLVWSGGLRGTPVDLEESIEAGEEVEDVYKRNSIQFSDYFRFDFGIRYQINKAKISHVLAFDIQNITNRENIYSFRYSMEKQEMKYNYQFGILPVFSYRIEF